MQIRLTSTENQKEGPILSPEELKGANEVISLFNNDAQFSVFKTSPDRNSIFGIDDKGKVRALGGQSSDPYTGLIKLGNNRETILSDGKITYGTIHNLSGGKMQEYIVTGFTYLIIKQSLSDSNEGWNNYQSVLVKTTPMSNHIQRSLGLI